MLLQIYWSLILYLLSGNTSSKPVMNVLYICRWWCEYKWWYRGQPYMNDVASGVPVVGPHVHVQQGLFVEASGKCSQCVLKTPRLLWDERGNQLSLKCSCKVSFNVVSWNSSSKLCPSLILDLLPVPNMHAQTLRVNQFETNQCAQLSLIKEAEVWSSGESREQTI